jgi:hypothetical protein
MVRLSIDTAATTSNLDEGLKEREQPKDRLQSTN